MLPVERLPFPVALLIAGAAVLLLRANEERLYEEAERTLPADGEPADEPETRVV